MARTTGILLALLFSAIPFVCCGARTALAHAVHVRSSPRHGEVISATPLLIEIWFDQPLFVRSGANTIEIQRDGQLVYAIEGTVDQGDRNRMYAGLPVALPPGDYEVNWTTLSALDGDSASGTFVFFIDPEGRAREVAPLQVTPRTPEPPTPAPAVVLGEGEGSSISGHNDPRVPRWTRPVVPALVAIAGTAAVIWVLRQKPDGPQ